jgi:opacity protein-like surface antigen
MQRIKVLTAAALCVASAATARAEGLYVSGFGGLSILPSEEFTIGAGNTVHIFDYEMGYSVGGAVGMRFAENVRAELELSLFSANIGKLRVPSAPITTDLTGDAHGIIGLANFWYDWQNESSFAPYFGFGLGLGHVTMDAVQPGFGDIAVGSDIGLAAQVGAGVRLAATDTIVVDLGYRFKTVRDLDFFVPDLGADTTDFSLNMHQFQFGLTYDF